EAGQQVAELVAHTHRLRETRMRNLISEWNAQVDSVCAGLTSNSPDLADAAIADLVGAAAVGLDGPGRAVSRFVGSAGEDAVASLQKDLAEWAQQAVLAEAENYLEAVAGLDLDPASAPT